MAQVHSLEHARTTTDLLTVLPPLAEYGDTVHYLYGGVERILLNNPEDITKVVSDPRREFPALGVLQRVLGQGLLAASDLEIWRPHRTVVQRGMSPRKVTGFTDVFMSSTRRMIASWRPGQELSIKEEMNNWALDNLGYSVFGEDFADYRAVTHNLLTETVIATHTAMANIEAGLPERGVGPRLEKAVVDLEHAVADIVVRRRNRTSGSPCLIDSMIEAHDSGDPRYADPFIRDEIITLLFAGVETAAVFSALGLFMTYRHRKVFQQVRDEVQALHAAGSGPDRYARDLVYVRMVMHEVMRIYAPIPFYHRPALEDREICGETVKKGTVLTASAWVTHRNPRYFKDPLTFDPDRWLPERKAEIDRNAYFPFGLGERNCVGSHFALQSIIIAIATITANVQLDFAEAEPAIAATPLMSVASPMKATVIRSATSDAGADS